MTIPPGAPSEEQFYVEVISTDPANPGASPGCWRGLIFNWNTGTWENKTSYVDSQGYHSSWCGASKINAQLTSGWTMWESYGLANNNWCGTIPSIRASFLGGYRSNGTFSHFTTSDNLGNFAFGTCFGSGTYQFQLPEPYNWHAYTPTG